MGTLQFGLIAPLPLNVGTPPYLINNQVPPRDSLRYSYYGSPTVHASLLTNISPPAGISDFSETTGRTENEFAFEKP